MDVERRQYVRISADCPVKYRVIGTDDSKQMKPDIFDPFSSMEVREIVSKCHAHQKESDRHMVNLLLWLDWKVTYLIKLLGEEKDEPFFPYQAVMADLSASGMKFDSPKTEPRGTRLQIRLILPILPFKELVLNAEVVRTRQRRHTGPSHSHAHAKFDTGVAFKDLKESDQEDLFRYIIKRERQFRYEEESGRLSVITDY